MAELLANKYKGRKDSISKQEKEYCIISCNNSLIVEYNYSFYNFLKYEQKELVGKPIHSIFSTWQPGKIHTEILINETINNLTIGQEEELLLKLVSQEGNSLLGLVKFYKLDQSGNIFLRIERQNYEDTILSDINIPIRTNHFVEQLIKSGPVLLRLTNNNFESFYFNNTWCSITGFTPSKLIKNKWLACIHPKDKEKLLIKFSSLQLKIKKYEITYRIKDTEGIYREVLESGIPLFNDSGEFEGYAAAATPLRELSIEEDYDLENAYSNHEPSVMFKIADAKFNFYYFSNQWLNFTGQNSKSVIGDNWINLIHENDKKSVQARLEQALQQKQRYEIKYRMIDTNGNYKWIYDSGVPLFDASDEFSGLISASIDISSWQSKNDHENLFKHLIDTEKKFQESLHNSQLLAISINKEGDITYCNDSFVNATGYFESDLIGENFVDLFIHAPNREKFDLQIRDIFKSRGYLRKFQTVILDKQGKELELLLSNLILYNAKGQIVGMTIVGENVTEQKRQSEELIRSNEQLKDLFDNANDLIQIFSIDGNIKFVNKIWKEKLGYSNEETSQLNIRDIVHKDFLNQTIIALDLILEGKKVEKFDTVFVSKSNQRIFLTGGVNCSYHQGKPIEFRGIFHDITDRVRAEKAQALYYKIANMTIHSSNLKTLFLNIHNELRNITEAKNFYVALIDKQNNILQFPYYFDERNKLSESEKHIPMSNGITEYAISCNKPLFLFERDIQSLEIQNKLKTRGEIPKIWLGVPLNLNNEVIGIISLQCYNSTSTYGYKDLELLGFISGQIALAIERKQKEQKINEQSARLKAIFESGTHLIWTVNKNMEFTSFNNNFFITSKNYYNYDEENANNPNGATKELILDSPYWKKRYKEVFNGNPQHFEARLIHRKNNQIIWKDVFLNPIYQENQIVEISGFAHDITEKKLSEIALLESEEKFRDIFESFQDIYFRCDSKGNMIMISPSVKELLGYQQDEVLNNHIANYYLYSTKTKGLIRELVKEKSVRNFEASIVRKDGGIIQCICNIRLIYKNHKPLYIEGVARDITKLIEANEELKKAKELAEKSLKVKEAFLANMSHEIRTPMNGVIGMIDLLATTRLNKEQEKYVQTIKKSSETLLNILNDILDLSKIEAGKMELKKSPVMLSQTMEKLYALFSQQAQSKGINMFYHLDENLPEKVLIDETRLLQVLSNLSSNAIKFTDGGGSINISLKTIAKSGTKNLIKFVVSDSGIGISEENQKKLFNSFTQVDNSSTKAFGGTGLGLAISRELCKVMGGDIGLYSALGLGSSFWFTIEAESTTQEVINEDKLLHSEVKLTGYFGDKEPFILLVDDNMVNRQVAGQILKKSGCKIDLAVNGQDAIDKATSKSYDIIFMDIQMPDMDGITATKKIKKRVKENLAPIVAMTAYSMKEDRERFLKAGLDDYISKPIKATELILKIKELLDPGYKKKSTNEPVESEVVSDVIINPEVVEQLEKYAGADMLASVYHDFEIEAREQINSCLESYKHKDYKNILINLHTLKGNSATLGIDKIAELSKHIEANLKNNNDNNLSVDLSKLEELYKEFLDFYPEFLKLK